MITLWVKEELCKKRTQEVATLYVIVSPQHIMLTSTSAIIP